MGWMLYFLKKITVFLIWNNFLDKSPSSVILWTMVDTTCRKCGKNDKSQVIGIKLNSRIYTFRCGHCGDEFVISGEEDDEKKARRRLAGP